MGIIMNQTEVEIINHIINAAKDNRGYLSHKVRRFGVDADDHLYLICSHNYLNI